MSKVFDKVKKAFNSGDFEEVITNVNELLEDDSTKRFSTEKLQKLYQYRIASLTHLGKNDESLNPLVTAHKYPAKYVLDNYDISSNIRLKYGNALSENCDLMLNSINEKKDLRSCPERSLSKYLYEMGLRMNDTDGKEIIISPKSSKNPDLPETVHIPCLREHENKYVLNKGSFKQGIKRSLLYAIGRRYQKVLIPPIGCETVFEYDDSSGKIEVVECLIDQVLNTLKNIDKRDKNLQILFICNHLTTYIIFKEVLDQRKSLPKKEVKKRVEANRKRETNIKKFEASINTDNKQYEQHLSNNIGEYLDSDFSILLKGETGAGKTYLVKKIRKYSTRKDEPFFALNCANLTGDTLEVTLFGADKGAYTGLEKNKEGLISKVGNGILFLDEIHTLEPKHQEKLLKVIEERLYRKYNSSTFLQAGNFRLISATNENIKERIKQDLFKEDFYRRINQIEFQIPPLRERQEDIPIISQSILKSLAKDRSKSKEITAFKITDEVANYLSHYNWPGNIRELEIYLRKAEHLCYNKNIEFIPNNLPPLPLNKLMLGNTKIKATDFIKLVGDILEAYCIKHADDIDNLHRDEVSFVEKIIKPIIVNHYFNEADIDLKKTSISKILSIEARYKRENKKNNIDDYLEKYDSAFHEVEDLLN